MSEITVVIISGILGLSICIIVVAVNYHNHRLLISALSIEVEKAESSLLADIKEIGVNELELTQFGMELLELRGVKPRRGINPDKVITQPQFSEKLSTLDSKTDLLIQNREKEKRRKLKPIINGDKDPIANEERKRNQAQLIYRVYDIAHASRTGQFVFDDSTINEVIIDTIVIDNLQYSINNVRAGNQIVLSSGDYRWLKVAGNSMNRAQPVPITPDDYILVDLDQHPEFGDIVVANLRHSPTPAERAGVVKRFCKEELRSESTESITPIPFTHVDIRGVVIAVAKPI
jgi:hypothetical protein